MDQFVSLFLIFSVYIVCKERGVNGSLIASSQTSFSQNTATNAATSTYYTSSYVTSSAASSSISLSLPITSPSPSISSSSPISSPSSSVSSSSHMSSPLSISSSSISSLSSSKSYSSTMLLSSSFAKYNSSSITKQIVDSKIVTSRISVKETVSIIFSSIYPTNVTVTTPRIPPQRVETRTLVILIVVAVFSVFLCYLAAFGIHGQKRSFNLETNKKKNHNEFDRLTSVGVPSHYGINVTDNPIKVTEKVKRKDEIDYKDSGSAFDNIALDKKDEL
ncbi:uncharacterized protein LOC124807928 [Hydra vulgaris]|uniref:Uncharacterized protein LOC124807928 n=1 Tax=Hydra vulgaris TaxID=6087 RepID=A0ABM4D2L1_HYDVU